MAIFLRHSWNVKPPRWGSPADVQYAIKVNSEKIYGVDPDSLVLTMPLFLGLPPMDYSGKNNHGTNHGATYKDGSLDFDGDNDFIDITGITTGTTITFSGWYNRENSDFIFDAHFGRLVIDFGLYGTANSLSFNDGAWKSFGSVPSNEWMHIAIVFNGSSGLATGYLNGNQSGSVLAYTPKSIGGQAALNSYFDGTNIQHYKGLTDEVCISNVARTADQIALFHDLPWGLYQPVSRPIYFFQAAEGISIPVAMQNMRGGFNPIGMRGGFINAD